MDTRTLLELLPAVEELGFDGVTLPDHLFLPAAELGPYPYSPDGKPPFRVETPWPDSLVLAGAIGACTSRVEITTAVYVLPLRNPLFVAKAAATAAELADGRFRLGVGAGWQRDEFDAVGAEFKKRGARMDESIAALRALWEQRPARHDGPAYPFGPLLMEPQPPRIPIFVGGGSDAAVRRAATLADGYIVPSQPLAGIGEQLDRVDAALAAAGREPDGFRVFVPCLEATVDEIAGALDPRITDITVMPWSHPGKVDTTVADKLAQLDRWAREVMGTLAA